MIRKIVPEKRKVKKELPKKDILEICLPASQIAEALDVPSRSITSVRMSKIIKEFAVGFDFLKSYGKTATIFGSSRFTPDNQWYQEAYMLGQKLANAGFAVITGGGPGVMEAANKGAFEAGGQSGGLNIELPAGQLSNLYVTDSVSFHYFFVRKVMLAFASEVYIFFPGGFGTLDEFFEITMLVQTKKIEPIPVVLVGKDYWQPLLDWIRENPYEKYQALDKKHLGIYELTQNADEAFSHIMSIVKEDRKQKKENT